MVNSKKMSKSSIAVIVLSILLVLSLILGFTGAWFTDSKDKDLSDDSLKFGTVAINLEEGSAAAWKNRGLTKTVETAYIVPGSSMEATLTLSNTGTEDVYIKVGSVANLSVGDKTLNGVEGITVTLAMDTEGANNKATAVDGHDGVYKLNSADKQDFKVIVSIATSVGNEITVGGSKVPLNGKTAQIDAALTLTLNVKAVQVANNTEYNFGE